MTSAERFIKIYKENIKREGADKLLEYLLSPQSDFFTAPASARFHLSQEGGLVEHSVNVYEALKPIPSLFPPIRISEPTNLLRALKTSQEASQSEQQIIPGIQSLSAKSSLTVRLIIC